MQVKLTTDCECFSGEAAYTFNFLSLPSERKLKGAQLALVDFDAHSLADTGYVHFFYPELISKLPAFPACDAAVDELVVDGGFNFSGGVLGWFDYAFPRLISEQAQLTFVNTRLHEIDSDADLHRRGLEFAGYIMGGSA